MLAVIVGVFLFLWWVAFPLCVLFLDPGLYFGNDNRRIQRNRSLMERVAHLEIKRHSESLGIDDACYYFVEHEADGATVTFSHRYAGVQ